MISTRPLLIAPAWLLALLFFTPVLDAQRPTAPKLLPENTLAYIRVHDAQDLVAAFKDSSTGRMLADQQMRPFIKDLYDSAGEAFQQLEGEVGLSLDELLELPRGEICFALVGADRGRPAPVLMIQVDDRLASAEKVVNRIIERIQGRGGSIDVEDVEDTLVTVMTRTADRRFVIFDRDGVLVLTTDLDLAKQLLKVWSGKADKFRTFADNQDFTAIMKRCVGTEEDRPQVTFFVDPIALVKQASRGNFQAQAALTLLNPLGLEGLTGVGGSMTVSTENFEGVTHLHLLLERPRSGVLEMLALDEGDSAPEDWAPEDAASYATFHWDFRKTYNELGSLLEKIRDEPNALDAEVQRRISDRLGIDFKDKILDALEGRVTLLTWMQQPHRLNSQCRLIAVKLKDSKAFRPTLEQLVGQLGDQVQRKSYAGVTYYRLPANPRRELDPDVMRIPEPSVFLLGDYAIFCDSQLLLEKVVRTKQQGADSLADSLDFKLMLSEIKRQAGERELGLVTFSRPDVALRSMYEFAQADGTRQRLRQNADSNAFFGALNRALSDNPLPPFATLQKYLTPSGSLLTNDETGFHFMQFSLKRED